MMNPIWMMIQIIQIILQIIPQKIQIIQLMMKMQIMILILIQIKITMIQ